MLHGCIEIPLRCLQQMVEDFELPFGHSKILSTGAIGERIGL
jgi:hypothetical protein